MTSISIVVRTRNETEWVRRCLTALAHQDWPDYEIIVVDNESERETREVVEAFDCRIVEISREDFTFGRSLNRGIAAARGELIAIISGHCISLNDKWLERLAVHFGDPKIAGVYGRQEPLPDTSAADKRDLWTTFGIERRTQVRDYMFHNANCMIRKSVWDRISFDESIRGVEDRDWARKVLDHGYRLVYEPTASVYHYHGIHHGRDEARAARVAQVIDLINRGESS